MRKLVALSLLTILTAAIVTPLIVAQASAEEEISPVTLSTIDDWTYIQNDVVTIAFPAGGKKPMFLWWYTNDAEDINVVKFKGLIEYSTYEEPYFLWRCQSEKLKLRESMQLRFYEPKRHMLQGRIRAILGLLNDIGNKSDLHAPYLPFSGSKWELTDPVNVTRGEVKYLSFNFTLIDVPIQRPRFEFAEDNIILSCRFYYTPATEDAYGKYAYSVNAGELKIDLIVKRWDWNIDKVEQKLEILRSLGLEIPKSKAGLALWVNLASINLTKLGLAEADADNAADVDLTESASTTRNMYIEGYRTNVVQNDTLRIDEIPLQNRWRERFRIRFEKSNATFAGFFKFVPQAIVTDGVTYNVTDVTASYVSAGNHIRLFIGYPYFGDKTLIHDPSLGVESVPAWMSTNVLTILIGVTLVIAVAVTAVKLRKKPINIIDIR